MIDRETFKKDSCFPINSIRLIKCMLLNKYLSPSIYDHRQHIGQNHIEYIIGQTFSGNEFDKKVSDSKQKYQITCIV